MLTESRQRWRRLEAQRRTNPHIWWPIRICDGRRRALIIKSVVQFDEGEYACDAKDDESTATLVVGGRDIRFSKKLQDKEVVESEKVVYELQLTYDDVECQWSVNGEVFKSSDEVEISLLNPTSKMSGLVPFKVVDGPKCEAQLDVVESPCSFTAPINDVTVLENDNGY